MSLRIVTKYQFEPNEIRKIQDSAPDARVEIAIAKTPEDFRERLASADIVYGPVTGKDLEHAPNLKWVQWGSAGVDTMDAAVRSSPLVVTNMARVFAPGIAETAMGMLLGLTRGIITLYMPQFQRHQMRPVGTMKSADHSELAGRTMGIVGMGGIGSAVARKARCGFDMRVVATDAKPIHKPEYVDEMHDAAWFPEMAPQVDVLVAAAPLTTSTNRMFNEAIFRSMKKTAYFVALSRGELFDDLALVKALKEGWIAGACLDVFPQEPPPPEHPIFDCPNVAMTAHTSGWSEDRQLRLIDFFAQNVRRFAAGQPLLNIVDKQAGY